MAATGRFWAVYWGVSGRGLWYFRCISSNWACSSLFRLFSSSAGSSWYGRPVNAHMVCGRSELPEGSSELESEGGGIVFLVIREVEDSGNEGGVGCEEFRGGREGVKSTLLVPPRWDRVTETCWKQHGQGRVVRQVLWPDGNRAFRLLGNVTPVYCG